VAVAAAPVATAAERMQHERDAAAAARLYLRCPVQPLATSSSVQVRI